MRAKFVRKAIQFASGLPEPLPLAAAIVAMCGMGMLSSCVDKAHAAAATHQMPVAPALVFAEGETLRCSDPEGCVGFTRSALQAQLQAAFDAGRRAAPVCRATPPAGDT